MIRMVTWALAMVAVPVSVLAANSAIKVAVADYNRLPIARTPLTLADSDGLAEANLPAWLDELGLTRPEAAALVAGVAAYRIDQDVYPARKKAPGFGKVVGNVAGWITGFFLAMATDDARRRANDARTSNTASNAALNSPPGDHASSPAWPTHEAHFDAVLLELGSCRGAWVSAVDKIEAGHHADPFTTFARKVNDELPAGARADPGCDRAD